MGIRHNIVFYCFDDYLFFIPINKIMSKYQKLHLPTLPMHIRRISNNWFLNTKYGKRIHISNIEKHLPKPKEEVKLWHQNYDNY